MLIKVLLERLNNMFQSIKKVLSSRLSEQGILQQAITAQIIELVKNYIRSRWGKSAQDSLRGVFLKQDTLEIRASSSVVTQEFKLAELEILEILQKEFPGKVKRLKIFG